MRELYMVSNVFSESSYFYLFITPRVLEIILSLFYLNVVSNLDACLALFLSY